MRVQVRAAERNSDAAGRPQAPGNRAQNVTFITGKRSSLPVLWTANSFLWLAVKTGRTSGTGTPTFRLVVPWTLMREAFTGARTCDGVPPVPPPAGAGGGVGAGAGAGVVP